MALDLDWVNSSWFERPRGRASLCESLWAGLPSGVVFRWANGEVRAFAAFSRFAQHLLRCLRCLYGCPGFAFCLIVPGAAGPVFRAQWYSILLESG